VNYFLGVKFSILVTKKRGVANGTKGLFWKKRVHVATL
jgi:hypothetical protein